jgi:hypothetical protein
MTFPLIANNARDHYLPVLLESTHNRDGTAGEKYPFGCSSHEGDVLFEDYYSNDPDINKWEIGDRLYQIRSKKYIDDYLRIISDASYGQDRQMVILLVGKLKVEAAIPVLIDLLEDEGVRSQAIAALGDFKRDELRPYFERFQNSKHSGWRKYANICISTNRC